jgi:hypothetical protein
VNLDRIHGQQHHNNATAPRTAIDESRSGTTSRISQ